MTLSRRATVVALLATSALTACGGQTTSQILADVQGAASAAESVISSLPQGTSVPAGLSTAVTALSKVVAALQGVSPSQTQGQTIVTDIQAVLAAAAPFVVLVPPPYGPAAALGVSALQAFLPVIASSLGIALAAGVAAKGIPTMSIADARAKFGPK